ncbi:pantoate--beta-alanine ligase [Pengzhenrongella sicca]|uniref:Pantothenate synthetase n=1 Tax=Pengzhenrongella sicca TaxID=2819238 RepID=A0A8A4ZEF6_9MICO|nr:pantoate--beta-alanine ligase [Pengzhenrongella sicca]QTE29791.1 pantoate--beta-alanine ligase [Pengzhenrongella sicca]
MTPPDPLLATGGSGGGSPAPDRSGARGTVLARTRAELDAALAALPATAGTGGRGTTHARAVVMTMGALHAGHLSLVARARELADAVVVTIFVNPLQFGPSEDLERYPRDLDSDLALLAGAGADVVFAPTLDVVFPDGDPVVRVSAGQLGAVLEGRTRPGHLDGVLTIVLKLAHLVRPDVAIFGQKDAQQVMAVQAMVRDLDVPMTVVAAPTVRDVDGLALSSRNAYLSARDRETALVLSRALRAAEDVARAPGTDADDVRAAARAQLAGADLDLDYLALVDPRTAQEVPAAHRGPAVLAVAATVGATRLIDNVPLRLGERAGSLG